MNTFNAIIDVLNTGTKPTLETVTQALLGLAIEYDRVTAPSIKAKAKGKGTRDYGPKSVTTMTDDLAFEIRFGKYEDFKVNEIVAMTGLSRGQVYSVRGNYTFRQVDESWVPECDEEILEDLESRIEES